MWLLVAYKIRAIEKGRVKSGVMILLKLTHGSFGNSINEIKAGFPAIEEWKRIINHQSDKKTYASTIQIISQKREGREGVALKFSVEKNQIICKTEVIQFTSSEPVYCTCFGIRSE